MVSAMDISAWYNCAVPVAVIVTVRFSDWPAVKVPDKGDIVSHELPLCEPFQFSVPPPLFVIVKLFVFGEGLLPVKLSKFNVSFESRMVGSRSKIKFPVLL